MLNLKKKTKKVQEITNDNLEFRYSVVAFTTEKRGYLGEDKFVVRLRVSNRSETIQVSKNILEIPKERIVDCQGEACEEVMEILNKSKYDWKRLAMDEVKKELHYRSIKNKKDRVLINILEMLNNKTGTFTIEEGDYE